MADAWLHSAAEHPAIQVHRGSVVDVDVHAVVSPANYYGWMRGGIDALYARLFPDVEATVRSAILALHGGELPVGEAMIVPTGSARPGWLISAPTMRDPGTVLPPDTVNPYLAALAVFRLWRDGKLDDGTCVRYSARFSAGGRIAQVGSRLIASTTRRLAEHFFEAFAASFGETAAPAVD